MPSRALLTFTLLFLLMVIDFADRQVMVVAFPYLREEWGTTDAQLGALVSVTSVSLALAAIPIAVAVDRWGRVRAIALMAVAWSGATAVSGMAVGYTSMVAARVAVGVSQAGYGPAGSALLTAAFPPERRATVLGAFQAAGPLGIVTGGIVGSLVAAGWGWRAAFMVLAVPGLILGVLFLFVPEPPLRGSRRVRRLRPALATLLRAPSAVGAMLGGALLLVIVSTLFTWLPSHLQRAYGMRPAQAGVLGSLVVVAGAAGTVAAAMVADRLARRDVRLRLVVPAVTATATAVTLGVGFAAVPAGDAQLLLVFVGGSLATTAVGPAAAAVVDVVNSSLRATATSLYVVVQNIFGLAVGPVVTGALAQRWGLTAALGAVALLGVPAAAVFWWASRFSARDRVETL